MATRRPTRTGGAGPAGRRRLVDRSARELGLAAEAVLVLGVAAAVVAVVPFRRTAAVLARRPLVAGADDGTIAAVRWAVTASARRVPWRALCFEQGLAAWWMLRRRGIACTVHYGVARADDGLAAHVWVRSGATDVVGCANSSDFAEVARFPPAPAEGDGAS